MIDLDLPAAAADRLPPAEAWAALEHRRGVLPLVAAFFERGAIDAAVAEPRRGALGLFTPAPEPGWAAGAVDGEPSGGGLLLRGDVRLPAGGADGALVLARVGDGEHRLAWIEAGAPGVEQRGARSGGAAGDGPVWLHLDGVAVPPALVSRPVTLAPDGELARHLGEYAGAWALPAALLAREGVHALRRAVRTTAHRGTAFNTAQLVALGISEVEIETDLTVAAAQRGQSLAVAAAAARTLALAVAKTEELRDTYGLEIDSPLAGSSGKTFTAFLGGQLLLENELARALGIREAHA